MTRFGFLSTYPPTRCGLATFTEALAAAIAARPDDDAVIVRVDDLVPAGAAVDTAGVRIVDELHPGDDLGRARAAARFDDCDVVVVQHEYGIYGGRDGDEVLDVLGRIRPPTIVVMHTVLADPSPHEREVTIGIVAAADAVVAMTRRAATLLSEVYGVPSGALARIPHGVVPWSPAIAVRTSHRPVVLTWGLIGPGKGIEWGIRAMAALDDLEPAPVYRVVGQTHPKVLIEQGERYREGLVALAEELGVAGAVRIDGRYRSTAELAAEVAAADLVLLPYDSRDQTTSGVLAEAVAAGKPVIATRFPHAVELLEPDGGVLVDHERPDLIAEAIRGVLADPDRDRVARRRRERAAAAAPAAVNTWDAVAERYRALAIRLANDRSRVADPPGAPGVVAERVQA